jgi:mannose-6-phosphate isomerase-like protein (cupin superfamily)
MGSNPVNVPDALASFDEIYSPRVVARLNDYAVKIAHTRGQHIWHAHDETDEFFLILDGQIDVAMRGPDGLETTVALRKGDAFVVPKGIEHRPSSTGGAILMFEPSGTSSTGDRHVGEVPDYLDTTTGRDLMQV